MKLKAETQPTATPQNIAHSRLSERQWLEKSLRRFDRNMGVS